MLNIGIYRKLLQYSFHTNTVTYITVNIASYKPRVNLNEAVSMRTDILTPT